MTSNLKTEPIKCIYCFNMGHWVPASLFTEQIECHLCDVCPMIVPVYEWEHSDHPDHCTNNGGEVRLYNKCPLCRAPILPDAEVAVCVLREVENEIFGGSDLVYVPVEPAQTEPAIELPAAKVPAPKVETPSEESTTDARVICYCSGHPSPITRWMPVEDAEEVRAQRQQDCGNPSVVFELETREF